VPGNGCRFAQVDNDLALAWARLHLTSLEASIVWVLQTKIMGAYDPVRRRPGRRDVRITERALSSLIGHTRPRVHEALHHLQARGVLRILDNGTGRRPQRVALCQDARLLAPPDGALPFDASGEEPAPDLAAGLDGMSPALRAAAEKARRVAVPRGEPQNLAEPDDSPSCSLGGTATASSGSLGGTARGSPGGTATKPPDTSFDKETAGGAASKDAPPASQPAPTDALFRRAARVIVDGGVATVPLLFKRCNVDAAAAAALLDQLEAAGYIGPQNGGIAREVFIDADGLARLEERP